MSGSAECQIQRLALKKFPKMYWHKSGDTKYARRQCPASGSARQIFHKKLLSYVWHAGRRRRASQTHFLLKNSCLALPDAGAGAKHEKIIEKTPVYRLAA